MVKQLKSLKQSEDKKAQEAIKIETKRAEQISAASIPPSKKKKQPVDPNKPKKNKTAYIMFVEDALKSKHLDDMKPTEKMSLIAKEWRELKQESKLVK